MRHQSRNSGGLLAGLKKEKEMYKFAAGFFIVTALTTLVVRVANDAYDAIKGD
jgi:hypothetical protein